MKSIVSYLLTKVEESNRYLAKYETDGVVIGTKNGNVLIMRYDSLVYEYVNGKYVELVLWRRYWN